MNPISSTFSGCTIIAKHQLAKARTLAQSWFAHAPASAFFVLLLDAGQGFFSPEREAFTIVSPSQLGIANIEDILFRYSFPEIVSILQPHFLLYLLEREPVGQLLYLSPDAWVL